MPNLMGEAMEAVDSRDASAREEVEAAREQIPEAEEHLKEAVLFLAGFGAFYTVAKRVRADL